MTTEGRVDSGLEGVVVAESALSRVDGEAGRLIIAGYDVAELAEHASFEQVCALLWEGLPPSAATHAAYRARLGEARVRAFEALPRLAQALAMDDPMDAYQVSKAGLVSLSRGLAMAMAGDGVRSNTVCPGAIDTPMLGPIYEGDPGRRDRMAERTPLRRLGTADDVARACLYLLSDDASFITGTDLVVDGGWLARLP